jgi:hypothetical protein
MCSCTIRLFQWLAQKILRPRRVRTDAIVQLGPRLRKRLLIFGVLRMWERLARNLVISDPQLLRKILSGSHASQPLTFALEPVASSRCRAASISTNSPGLLMVILPGSCHGRFEKLPLRDARHA